MSRGKRWSDLGQEQLIVMSRKAGLPKGLVLSAAVETVAAFREIWSRDLSNLPIDAAVREVFETQLKIVPLARA